MAPSGDIFDDLFGPTPSKKSRKKKQEDLFSMGDIGLEEVGSFDLFGSGGDSKPSQKIFKVGGKNFIEDPSKPGKLIRVSKKNKKKQQQKANNDEFFDIFNMGGGGSKSRNDSGIFSIGGIGDTKQNPSIIGNKKQVRETQESIDIITNDAKRAGGAIKGGISSLRKTIQNRRGNKIKIDNSQVTQRSPIQKEPEIQIDDSGSTASKDSDKEFCFQATKDGRTTVRCFRNSQIALRTREQFVSQGWSVTAIDAKTRI